MVRLSVDAEIGDGHRVTDRLARLVGLEHRVVVRRIRILADDVLQRSARFITMVEGVDEVGVLSKMEKLMARQARYRRSLLVA